MRLFPSIFVLPLMLAAGLPAQAVSGLGRCAACACAAGRSRLVLQSGRSGRSRALFQDRPGWHVYWKNAGDAGEPPHMKWTLPDGIAAGPLEFPAPKRLPLGPLMDFGYENEVLFPFKLERGADGQNGAGRCFTPRWTGWFARRAAFPARPSWR
jgi:DsbC/DsbD-like thiol-disulfide interchange protein